MIDYYKKGYLEATLFLFYRNGKILIEHRPKEKGTEIFIPNGRIDKKDLDSKKDYRIAGMEREINEEFNNKVVPKEYIYLGEFIVENLKIKFYGYLILKWEGDIPNYTVENGIPYAKLEWIPIETYANYLKFESALFFVKKAKDILAQLKND